MAASYVALLTGFYVDNGPQLPLWDRLPTVGVLGVADAGRCSADLVGVDPERCGQPAARSWAQRRAAAAARLSRAVLIVTAAISRGDQAAAAVTACPIRTTSAMTHPLPATSAGQSGRAGGDGQDPGGPAGPGDGDQCGRNDDQQQHRDEW